MRECVQAWRGLQTGGSRRACRGVRDRAESTRLLIVPERRVDLDGELEALEARAVEQLRHEAPLDRLARLERRRQLRRVGRACLERQQRHQQREGGGGVLEQQPMALM